jgi:hypothetical protein
VDELDALGLARASGGGGNCIPYTAVLLQLFVSIATKPLPPTFAHKHTRPHTSTLPIPPHTPEKRQPEGTANEEREQTLNQLLTEMDGFTPDTGVVFIGATNRCGRHPAINNLMSFEATDILALFFRPS